jgi:predicted enzyme related to lactoylglutathione lyase
LSRWATFGYDLNVITGVDVVFAGVKNMDQAVYFYQQVLGLTVVHQSPYWSSIKAGNSMIGLHGGQEAPPAGGWLVCLETPDLDALEKQLRAHDVHVGDRHQTPRGWLIDFADPDGNRLQAIQLSESRG